MCYMEFKVQFLIRYSSLVYILLYILGYLIYGLPPGNKLPLIPLSQQLKSRLELSVLGLFQIWVTSHTKGGGWGGGGDDDLRLKMT